MKLERRTSSQWPPGPVGFRSTRRPPIVFIAISGRPSLSASATARPRPFSFRPGSRGSGQVAVARAVCAGRDAHRFGARAETVTGIAPAARTRSGRPVFCQVDPRGAPAGEAGAEGGVDRGPCSRTRGSRSGPVGGRRLLARVGDEQADVACVARDAHPRIRVGNTCSGSRLSSRKPRRAGSARRRRATARLRRARSDPRRSRHRGRGGRRRLVDELAPSPCRNSPLPALPGRRPRESAGRLPRSGRADRGPPRGSSGTRRARPGRARSGRCSRRRTGRGGRRRSRPRRRRRCTSRVVGSVVW